MNSESAAPAMLPITPYPRGNRGCGDDHREVGHLHASRATTKLGIRYRRGTTRRAAASGDAGMIAVFATPGTRSEGVRSGAVSQSIGRRCS